MTSTNPDKIIFNHSVRTTDHGYSTLGHPQDPYRTLRIFTVSFQETPTSRRVLIRNPTSSVYILKVYPLATVLGSMVYRTLMVPDPIDPSFRLCLPTIRPFPLTLAIF